MGMDSIGGLPSMIESTAKSVCLRGDGSVFVRSADEHWVHGDLPNSPVLSAQPLSPYVVKAGDTLECLWGKGLVEVSASDDEGSVILFKVKDANIPRPPKKPLYALMGC